MFCVACGTETTELTERGLCRACFARDTVFLRLPERLDVEMCVHCGSRKRGEIWLLPSRVAKPGKAPEVPPDEVIAETARVAEETAIEGALLEPSLVAPRFAAGSRMQDQHAKMWSVELSVSGTAEGFPVSGDAKTTVRVKGATCLRCSRMQGGYHEAIVQVRGTGRPLSRDELAAVRRIASRLIERVVGEGDANAFVLKDLEIDGGLDIYFGTTNAGRMATRLIVQELGAKATEHAKLVGQKDGLDLYRMTFAIRVPPYARGDLVILDEEPWVVSAIGTKGVTLRKTDGSSTRTLDRDALERATVLSASDAKEAVVVTRSEKEFQILDPSTYATISVLRPAGMGDDEPTVRVVRWEDEWLVLPPARAPRADGPEGA